MYIKFIIIFGVQYNILSEQVIESGSTASHNSLQVVHSLQTKNDEHEETAQQLQTQHETELQRVVAEGVALQQQLREERRRRDQLQVDVKAAQEEKGKLVQDQVHTHVLMVTIVALYMYSACCTCKYMSCDSHLMLTKFITL